MNWEYNGYITFYSHFINLLPTTHSHGCGYVKLLKSVRNSLDVVRCDAYNNVGGLTTVGDQP